MVEAQKLLLQYNTHNQFMVEGQPADVWIVFKKLVNASASSINSDC